MGILLTLPVHDARDHPVRYLAEGGGTVIEFPRRELARQAGALPRAAFTPMPEAVARAAPALKPE